MQNARLKQKLSEEGTPEDPPKELVKEWERANLRCRPGKGISRGTNNDCNVQATMGMKGDRSPRPLFNLKVIA